MQKTSRYCTWLKCVGACLLLTAVSIPVGAQDTDVIQFQSLGYTVKEAAAGGRAVITVVRLAATTNTVTADYTTTDEGTAQAGLDYTATSGTVTFGPRVTTATFTVPITPDGENEANETVQLRLIGTSEGARVGGYDNATLTITDDDPCRFTLPATSRTFGPDTTNDSLTVTATEPCSWTATRNVPWIGITTGSSVGTGPLQYSLDPNTNTTARSGVITILPSNVKLTVTQRGVPPRDVAPPVVRILTPTAGARLTNVSSATVTGTATDNRGVVSVEYRLENAAGTNQYMTAENTTSWAAHVEGLIPGLNTVRVRARDATNLVSAEVTRVLVGVTASPLNLLVSPGGRVKPDQNGQLLEVGRDYPVSATALPGSIFVGWSYGAEVVSTAPKFTFRMADGLIVQATFIPNPFLPVAGSYQGLFRDDANVEHASSGFLSAAIQSSGAFSAKLTVAGTPVSLSGRFNPYGMITNTIRRAGLPDLVVRLFLHVDVTDDHLTGDVTDGTWTAMLTADRARFHARTNLAPARGRYTFLLPGADTNVAPAGTSVGTLLVSDAGMVTLAGTLADGTKISQKVPLAKDGRCPLYVALSRGGGSAQGWMQFDPANSLDASGRITWTKTAAAGRYYAAGFVLQSDATAARYEPLAPGGLVVSYTNAMIHFSGGNLPASFNNTLVLFGANKVANPVSGANPISMTITPSTGLFAGSVTVPGTGTRLKFTGAFHRLADTGGGFFLGTSESGLVQFGP